MDWTPYAVGGAASRPDSFTGLNPQMAAAVYQMVQDAHAAGIPLQITSAYRSPEVQAQLWQAALQKYGSPEAARKWVAPPGHSQHNHGTAVDFALNGSLLRDANSPAAQWIAENAARYGLDVPMAWEPWQVELAGARGKPAGTAYAGATAPSQPSGYLGTQNALAGLSAPQNEPENRLRVAMMDPAAFMNRPNQLQLLMNEIQPIGRGFA